MRGIPCWLDDDLRCSSLVFLRRATFLCPLNKFVTVLQADLQNLSGVTQVIGHCGGHFCFWLNTESLCWLKLFEICHQISPFTADICQEPAAVCLLET